MSNIASFARIYSNPAKNGQPRVLFAFFSLQMYWEGGWKILNPLETTPHVVIDTICPWHFWPNCTDSSVRKFLLKKRFTLFFAFIGDGLYEYPVKTVIESFLLLVFIVPLSCLLPGHLERGKVQPGDTLLQQIENVLPIILYYLLTT